MSTWQAALMVAIFALTTFATRVLAFLLFPAGRPTPKFVLYLGRVLPYAITGMLIVYCLKDISVAAWPFGVPELLGVLLVVGLYLAFKNSLLAIAAGTVLYMLLVQLVFNYQ